MNKKSGFTIIEICVLAVFLVVVGAIFTLQKFEISEKNRDEKRKTAINAIYFSLEEDFYKHNGFYPKEISEKNLKSIDPNTFTDPKGGVLGKENAEYRYEPTDCDGEKCKKYTLHTTLEKESDFIKKSRN